MKNSRPFKIYLLLLAVALFTFGCAASSNPTNKSAKKETKKIYNPTGVWEYYVETPDGGSSGVMRVIGNPGAYEVTMETDQFGVLELQGVSIVDGNLTGTIEVMGNFATVECVFAGETMGGSVFLGPDAFPLTGERVSK